MNKTDTERDLFESSAVEVLLAAESALEQWGRQVSGFEAIHFGPRQGQSAEGVHFSLIQLNEGEREVGGRHLPRLSADLIYSVSVQSEDARKQRGALFALFMAAREHESYQLADIAVPNEMLYPTAPAAFSIRIPVFMTRIEQALPRVMGTLGVESIPTVPVEGRVFGPGRLPVVGAVVRVAGLDRRAVSDEYGRFRFESVPTGQSVVLNIAAKGRSMEQDVLPDQKSFVEIEMDF